MYRTASFRQIVTADCALRSIDLACSLAFTHPKAARAHAQVAVHEAMEAGRPDIAFNANALLGYL